MELRVIDHLRELPFFWTDVDHEPGPESDRVYLERNTKALVSIYVKDPIDVRVQAWFGHDSPSPLIRMTGLCNVNHVDETYVPVFPNLMDEATGP